VKKAPSEANKKKRRVGGKKKSPHRILYWDLLPGRAGPGQQTSVERNRGRGRAALLKAKEDLSGCKVKEDGLHLHVSVKGSF